MVICLLAKDFALGRPESIQDSHLKDRAKIQVINLSEWEAYPSGVHICGDGGINEELAFWQFKDDRK